MAQRRKRKKCKKVPDFDDSQIMTKRWLRHIIREALKFWAPILKLSAYVDEIAFYITEANDSNLNSEDGACITISSSTRTATIKIKRTAVKKFAGEYRKTHYSPADVVEMTVIHELCHILTHPMSQWAHNTMESMRSGKVLEKNFEEQEEISVEHMTRALFALKDYIEPQKKFKGKIVYLTKDPDEDE